MATMPETQRRLGGSGSPPRLSRGEPDLAGQARWSRGRPWSSRKWRGAFIDRSLAERTTFRDLLVRYERANTVHRKGAAVEACRIQSVLRDPIAGARLTDLTGPRAVARRAPSPRLRVHRQPRPRSDFARDFRGAPGMGLSDRQRGRAHASAQVQPCPDPPAEPRGGERRVNGQNPGRTPLPRIGA